MTQNQLHVLLMEVLKLPKLNVRFMTGNVSTPTTAVQATVLLF